MQLIQEPTIPVKMHAMQQRVCWQDPAITSRQIDQTQLAFSSELGPEDPFSFLVLGDSGTGSGTGRHRRRRPQCQVAKLLMEQGNGASFVLHTGDLVYQVGSSEQYRRNFIRPYRDWLVGGDQPKRIAYDQMTFKLPFFPVLGNHDYYDLPLLLGLLSGITGPLQWLLRSLINLDVGWHGSHRGDAFARAFLDYLKGRPKHSLGDHLDQHYTSRVDDRRCLTYRPGNFTRLPNRYYSFRHAGIDVFALDSNTFNQPLPGQGSGKGGQKRQDWLAERAELHQQKAERLKAIGLELLPSLQNTEPGDRADDLAGEIEAIDEQLLDIEKRLNSGDGADSVDQEQLDWLRDRLVASWRNPAVRGRVLVLHHPPYVTEATKWFQGQTLAVRHQLRRVLDQVAAELEEAQVQQGQKQPLLDLVLSGHAHCLELLRSGDTGHGDAHIPWLICGGSGYSLRRQRPEGADLQERIEAADCTVAYSQLFIGRSGKGSSLRRPYSAVRLEVSAGRPPRFTLRPLVAERRQHRWESPELEPITF
ncbi:metallophosphoesterase [Synechococcus sp. CS-602]|uniref:metallophosphoesterase family protein n=1 Tax=Synechococcaceae TaxID=1890426 RepID=UPI0008FF5B1C|nr:MULTISPECIES: metallophosphoesterase [Synechococcaceae]MCT4364058.1 metallophosphoesterase [Candidatus Regnicoccus frigidus MAG-AL1]APD47685.1 metallophosphoesterase [Synechococcus sp. SynAce01]MCT0201425.1 metallophosphoesterase [Synechococcus sp. CS-603]MCT0205976.1 metallophosphoesterase [Synechococcus sp. CS-602]MCT0245171.1 metallophosphoesterase [Synechococcus sp. CS-601]